MASNFFGQLFRITTWGESHGKAIGVVIDGCPAGLELTEQDINAELSNRQGGQSAYTTPRKESDQAEILSGVFEGKTTGAPISIIIYNQNVDSSKYEPIKHLMRPGHANFTYLEKYGIFDYRGGGRSSARETAARVAAGAVARKLLTHFHIEIAAYMKQIGTAKMDTEPNSQNLRDAVYQSPVYCPDEKTAQEMAAQIEKAKEAGDSLGGVIEFFITGLPVGLGDPIYAKVEALLASAMMSIPATKGFEVGSGFQTAAMKGSEHNDAFIKVGNRIETATNLAGGTLGGITTGMPLIGRVAFKPTSSIQKTQQTVNLEGDPAEFKLPEGSRHDPCVAIRAVPIVEAMASLVIADCFLLNRCIHL